MPTPPLASVLLVDDDRTTNYLNQLLLQKTMHVAAQVLVAENGQHDLATLQQSCAEPSASGYPQLILLDMNMPVINGMEFLEAYAQLPAAQHTATVVVMLTTSLHEVDQQQVRQLPIADFINKPLNRSKVNELPAQHFALPAQ